MKGFKIKTSTQNGEDALINDLNTNKKIFETVKVSDDPFFVLDFFFRRTPQARMVKKMFDIVPEKEIIKHLSSKLESLGCTEGEDFEIVVMQGD